LRHDASGGALKIFTRDAGPITGESHLQAGKQRKKVNENDCSGIVMRLKRPVTRANQGKFVPAEEVGFNEKLKRDGLVCRDCTGRKPQNTLTNVAKIAT